jgi:glycosyltransferase involved in cell wall biosynthesis
MIHNFSIITPSFNQGQYLEQAITSVLSQWDTNIEYLVIDGGSTDNSVEIIKKHENKLSYWESMADKGQSHAINKGLSKCSGEIFNWLCSDDYLEPEALIIVSELFHDNYIRIVSGKFRLINEVDMNNPIILDGIILDDTPEKTFARCTMTQPATYWRMEDIRKFGGINERLHYFMDLELLLKYLLHYGLNGIKKTDKILANYRVHPESKTAKEMDNSKIKPDAAFNIEKNNMFYFLAKKYGLNKKIQEAIKKLMNKKVDEEYIMEHIPEKPALDIRKAINIYLYDFLRRHFHFGDISKAWKIAWSIEKNHLDPEEKKGLIYLRRKLVFWKLFNFR